LVTAAANLPHKAFIYGALLALIAQSAELSLTNDIISKILEQLQTHLVEDRNIYASKNLLRYLSIAYEFGVIKGKPYSQMLL